MKKRIVKIVKCLICNSEFPSVGLDSHLKHKHNITSKEYKLKYISVDKSSYKYNCLVCNDKFNTERLLSHHIRINHNLDKLEYVKQYVFNNVTQLCKCGCDNEIKLLGQHPYRRDYISGHNPNGMINKLHSVKSKSLMRNKALDRIITNITNKKDTNIELEFKTILDNLNINYIHQYKVNDIGLVDFYLIDYNLYIEIDGSFWHPHKIENLNFQQLSNVINDLKKNKYFKDNKLNLIRIKDNEIKNIKSIDDILKIKNDKIKIGYYDKIITKEYIEDYINKKGIDKFNKLLYLFIKFLRIYINDYPYPNNEFNFNKINNKLKNSNYILENKTFKNNISNVGVNELKTIFKNYWKSNYKNNKSPFEIFNDDIELKKIIYNRLVINKNDFSLATINRGMSVLRYNISFFKPQTAYNVFKYFLNTKLCPIVIDPCVGFGGRLIGFICAYPNGKYIGIEPNVETYNYLLEIKNKYLNGYDIELYNTTLEEFILNNPNIKADLSFTSIPYYDKENYSGLTIKYKNKKEWETKFIGNLIKYPNLIVNIPNDLEYLFTINYETFYLENNISNFNKNSNLKTKRELIIKIKNE